MSHKLTKNKGTNQIQINYNGNIYIYTKQTDEMEHISQEKAYFIAKQEPNTDEEYLIAEHFADIYCHQKYLNCQYSSDIQKKLEPKVEKYLNNI